MILSNTKRGKLLKETFPDGDSSTTFTISSKTAGFLILKAISSNDSYYKIISFIVRDDGAVVLNDIQSLAFYDLLVTLSSSSNNTINIDITDGGGGGTSGGTLYIETIHI